MILFDTLRHSDLGVLVRREYWRIRGRREYDHLGDYGLICKLYSKLGLELNLKDPQRYTEKLQWLKLFYRDDIMPICSDKYLVRNYLKENGYDYLLNELIASYTDVKDIDIESLPNSFVIKASHGSGWNLIVKDKSKINWYIWKKIMRSWMKQDLSWFGAEWNYANPTPRIIVEKYLEDDSGSLRDYKIICANGEPKYFQIDESRFTNHKWAFTDLDGNLLPMTQGYSMGGLTEIKFTDIQYQMIKIARELSKPFINVRVDFYECNGKIYFGELTFFDGSGFFNFQPDEWDYIWGKNITLPAPNYNLELYQEIMK